MSGRDDADDPSSPAFWTDGSARAEWRAEEEAITRAAAEHWTHRRSLADRARDWVHRGDELTALAGRSTFTGIAVATGDDVVSMQTTTGRVDVALAHGTFRVTALARRPGRPAATTTTSLRARLLELETSRREVTLGRGVGEPELCGSLTVGRDHVAVVGDGGETYLAVGTIAWIARWTGV